jgi:predicted DCC family thiol-disulfide oxidoreductase YuxK
MTMDATHVVVFDGVCNLCSHAVNFILARERDHMIRFAAAQSVSGQELLRKHGFDPQDLTTFVFIKGGMAHIR